MNIDTFFSTIAFSNVDDCEFIDPCDHGDSNMDTDPMFVNPSTGNYRLLAGSPCLDAGEWLLLPCDEYTVD